MAKIVWDRRDDIKNAVKTIPPVLRESHEDFRPPKQILTDFQRLLNHDVPYINWTCEILHDWYSVVNQTDESMTELTVDQVKNMYIHGTRIFRVHHEGQDPDNTYYDVFEDGTFAESTEYEPYYIRAQMTPIDWKSKIGNSDMSVNFKADHFADIQKGDMCIREDGMLYMLNWNVFDHANNQATQAVEINAVVDVTRESKAVTDARGMIIEPAGKKMIAPGLPVSHSEYAGRPDYSSTSQIAGILPDHLITVSCQWNMVTRMLKINDEFVIGEFTYRIINMSLAEVNVDKDYGVLVLNAKRVAGGSVA